MTFERLLGDTGIVHPGQTLILELSVVFPVGSTLSLGVDFTSSSFYADAFPVNLKLIRMGGGITYDPNSQTILTRKS